MMQEANACEFRVNGDNEWIIFEINPKTHPTNDRCLLMATDINRNRRQPFCLVPERSGVTCPIAQFYNGEKDFKEARKELHDIRGMGYQPLPQDISKQNRLGLLEKIRHEVELAVRTITFQG